MDIYLYGTGEYIKFPVTPLEIEVDSPQDIETFESLDFGDLKIIGKEGNRKLSIESFFPNKNYAFRKDYRYNGMEYINKIKQWRSQRNPLTIIITDLNINFKCVIESLTYSIKDGSGDIYYTISIDEYFVPGIRRAAAHEKVKTTPVNQEYEGEVNFLTNTYGIVTAKDGLTVRSGKGIGYNVLGRLNYGDKVHLFRLEDQGAWWNIYYTPHGGYVASDWIRRI